MLIAKIFLPMSSPGLAAVGLGALATVSGAYNAAEVIAIVLGLFVVAVAGVFTIRSNVAKIWREQAEGEKARNLDLTAELAEALKDHAAVEAKMKVEWATEVSACNHLTELEREAKERALAELTDATKRTDQAPVIALLEQILEAVRPS